ncbi:hypothetical protein [Paenibacillus sp. J2TS4]|uniref:hypothetical protein n=1 Tax=Paenibacillus sp. J2TS4 TaxID=2807194 RepID=UPI001B039E4D|nr:hypothetical protein [Paenibacillus sp. J2TS4]GIP31584.1 hypothetical protein J2TS4_07940 [Paenibacillus sp. J2TS4]
MTNFRIDMDGRNSGPWMGHCLSEMGCIWLADTPQGVLPHEREHAAIVKQTVEAYHAFTKSL